MDSFDIALKVKSKHGQIYRYMQENNLNAVELAKHIGISSTTFFAILHFRWFPKGNGRGETRKKQTARKLCDFFQCKVNDLFPPELCDAIKNNKGIQNLLQNEYTVYKEIDLEYLPFYQLPQLSYQPDFDEKIDHRNIIPKALLTLKPREAETIKLRFGLGDDNTHTLEEVARNFSITKERVRQIEAKALRKLKHPKRELRQLII